MRQEILNASRTRYVVATEQFAKNARKKNASRQHESDRLTPMTLKTPTTTTTTTKTTTTTTTTTTPTTIIMMRMMASMATTTETMFVV